MSMVLHLRAEGLGQGDEHQPMLSVEYGKLYLFTFFMVNLGPKIRKWDTKRRLADLDLTNQRSAQPRPISMPYIWLFGDAEII